MKGRTTLAKALLVGVVLTVCAVGLEMAARLVMLADRDTPFDVSEYPLYEFDENVGYRYRPNIVTRNVRLNALDEPAIWLNVQVNNHGHISHDDDQFDKPDEEFRVAVIGDSFTGALTNLTPWPDFLEDKLDADEQLKGAIGAKTIRTVNLGMDGTGVVQWPAVYRHQAVKYAPDLVLVNFITHDLTRRFIWRTSVKLDGGLTGFLACSSLPATIENTDCMYLNMASADPSVENRLAAAAQARRDLTYRQVKRARWGSMYPHLLSAGLRRWGLARRFGTLSMRYLPEQGAEASAAALREIVAAHSETLIFHIPHHGECAAGELPEGYREFAKLDTGAPIQTLLDDFIGDGRGDPEALAGFYNLPHDGHFSEAGAERYAGIVYKRVRAHLLGQYSELAASEPLAQLENH